MPRKPKRSEDFSLEASSYAEDLERCIRESIERFFRSKEDESHKSISESLLYSKESYNIVLKTPFDDRTFHFIHEHCLTKIPKHKWYKDTTVPWRVHFLLRIIDELKFLKIPKDFQAGMILLFFKFCKGIQVPVPL